MKVLINREVPQVVYQLLSKENIEYSIWNKEQNPTTEEILDLSKDIQGILSAGMFKMEAHFMEQAQHLKVISLLSVGYDHVDLNAAKQFGIKIGNTPNVLSNATADTAFLLLLATSRKAFHHYRRITEDNWGMFKPTEGLGIELYGKTLGIFGLGKIGLEMAKRCAAAYQMKIIYHNRNRNLEAEKELNATYVSFDELVAQSDVISAHSALTVETRGIFNLDIFKKMKPNAIFINTGRGGLHVETDLITALENKIIWGAGLDVFEHEPTPSTNPLLYMENVCCLPHIGSATEETRNAMAKLATENLIAALKGLPMPAEVK